MQTVGDLHQSMQAALAHQDAFSVLNVHLDSLDVSPALKRLATRMSKVIEEEQAARNPSSIASMDAAGRLWVVVSLIIARRLAVRPGHDSV